MKLPVYLDHNATTPCDPRVLEAMLPWFSDHFGNAASRTHAFGWLAAEVVEASRDQVADLIAAEPGEIVFTSGATESVNLAIKGLYERYATRGNHVITVSTEHKAVIDTCRHIEKKGAEISWLPVRYDGLIDLAHLEAAIRPETILICVMYANNETGVIQPIAEIGRIAKRKKVAFFSDATQAVGKLSVNVDRDGLDLLALSAHKIYGPKGAGALYVRRRDPRISLTAQMDGGGHERGMRSGTLNVPGIVGLGKASALCLAEMEMDRRRIEPMRDRLEQALLRLDGARINGSRLHRLPGTTNMSFAGVEGSALLASLAREVALSSGSACTSAVPEPSYVLKALGVEDEIAFASMRMGLGRFTTEEEIDLAIEKIGAAVERCKGQTPGRKE